ncbi:MAG TPA: hypothetical protein VH599_04825 [Ktedonobacterales bacterium]
MGEQYDIRLNVTCSAAILAAQRWPAGPLACRAHATCSAAVSGGWTLACRYVGLKGERSLWRSDSRLEGGATSDAQAAGRWPAGTLA